MDYRINNEAIVACVIAQVVKRGPYDIPIVVGAVNLLMRKKFRKKALTTSGDNMKELTMIFGQLDGSLLGVILNSMTMLIEGGMHAKSGRKTCFDRFWTGTMSGNDWRGEQNAE